MAKIRLFWWNEIIIQNKTKENYGDLLGKYLVEKISGKQVEFAWPKKWNYKDWYSPIYFTIGSILANVNEKCIVWGSGIISKDYKVKDAKFLAVRGPETFKFLREAGYQVPEIFGDPALLLPDYFNPKVEKKYRFGIIPHYNDYKQVENWFNDLEDVVVINLMTNDVERTTIEILECENIISSSLHGIIVSHAYNIPAVWQKFSENVFGDDIKYLDYMESVNISFYKSIAKTEPFTYEEIENIFKIYPVLPESRIIKDLKNDLMSVCPF
ncbi:exoV-like protein [Zunongwangia profunda SM-A87]|uniref:ExoV-like protein n=1 Tax=Zunongwangia profunda (strain DSM 18752 / CCTCC AB 206139 / SM-A87) TaxID=655815 RepID=D5BIK0_ZUNPS|nr:polysaccharide pyruvyl transferase family protein [Zunongwangia profunda]ADF51452.1 exoV-like protein [Zunongwangia profunda SM-A87]|tara:strand:- start:472 stop:1278 length:807 start_codon:yes stop_codon:yes gene_type:complete